MHLGCVLVSFTHTLYQTVSDSSGPPQSTDWECQVTLFYELKTGLITYQCLLPGFDPPGRRQHAITVPP